MPIWLRNFTFRTIQEHFEKVNKPEDTMESGNKKSTTVKVPTYTTKARK